MSAPSCLRDGTRRPDPLDFLADEFGQERNLAGNAIDFYVNVLGLSFHEAMRELIGS